MYVYIQSEPSLWTVGHYAPDETWHPDSDHDVKREAAARVHYLNGGSRVNEQLEACQQGLAYYMEAHVDYLETKGRAVAEDTLEIRETLRAAIAAATEGGAE